MKKKLHYYMELKYEITARELPKSQGGGPQALPVHHPPQGQSGGEKCREAGPGQGRPRSTVHRNRCRAGGRAWQAPSHRRA